VVGVRGFTADSKGGSSVVGVKRFTAASKGGSSVVGVRGLQRTARVEVVWWE